MNILIQNILFRRKKYHLLKRGNLVSQLTIKAKNDLLILSLGEEKKNEEVLFRKRDEILAQY